jgi:hypothetical protein
VPAFTLKADSAVEDDPVPTGDQVGLVTETLLGVGSALKSASQRDPCLSGKPLQE